MTNKEIQDQRMRRYFIDAAKETIKGEGIRALTVRNVAARAGYSYATLYNYFKDVRMLIFECIGEFLEELSEFVNYEMLACDSGENRIRGCARGFVKFYVQYPSIFRLIFMEEVTDVSFKRMDLDFVCSSPNIFIEDDWAIWAKQKKISKSSLELHKENFRLCLTGMLLLFMNRRCPSSYEEFSDLLDRQLAFVLKGGK